MTASGSVPSPPAGGPIPRPIAAAASEVRIPIPAGATYVSFDWEFFNSEASPSAPFNDGLSVDVVAPAGNLVGDLVYADTNTPAGTCVHSTGGTERAPAAPADFLAALPRTRPATTSRSSSGTRRQRGREPRRVDNVVFDSVVPGCAVPCFGVTPALSFSSPGGPGCFLANLSGLPSGGTYFLAATLNPPPGWLYGVNIGIPELVGEINAGYPFWGPLSSGGCSGTARSGRSAPCRPD